MGNLGISIVDDETDYDSEVSGGSPTVIKVVGCGGGGSNAVNRMIFRELSNVDFIVLNTDLQALGRSKAPTKLAIGQKVTKGLGAGGKPEVGEQAAEEDKELITNELRGADMVFITAGMGGGTGTGSAPVVARIAKELGCLTVAVVTTPFEFEGNVRMRQAKEGLIKLHEQVDSLIVIPNEQLFKNIDKNLTVKESFRKADEVLCQGVEGISNIITNPGDVNTDFADVRNAMAGQGNAIFGIGIGEGENRATDAAYNAIHNPMLENSRIDGAKNLLVNICASEEITLSEVGEICKIVSASADKDYNMFWGQVTQPELEGKISVTVIATGFEDSGKIAVEQKEEEPETPPEPKVLPNDVVGRSELDMLLHPRAGSNGASLGGEFVASHTVSKEAESSEKKGSLVAGMFDEDKASSAAGSFVPPAGFVPDQNDLMKPAIWNKSEYSRTIRLDD
ncbi:MAG: cell division protein FtsZ [Treponema sp.]|nr:cell division protein FtsZ [Spirochaetia bacterium]MDD7534483.1 cell division protein FtsZ [Treponema sp.]MDY3721697.1 cell division protein FtsZ [Treponema sp.]MDY5757665.1 cell division protein FtsZ [Treponema sp.]MDY5819194.1 cell division protein FtsZ [Treponema sp.]